MQTAAGRRVQIHDPPLTQETMWSLMKQTVKAALENPEETLTDPEFAELYDHILGANAKIWQRYGDTCFKCTLSEKGMRLFKDEALTVPLDKKGIEFGTVWAMETKTRTIWLWNNTGAFLKDIVVDVGPEVKVDAPTTLKINEKAPIKLTYKPNTLKDLNRVADIQAVKMTINIQAIEVYSSENEPELEPAW